MSWRACCSTSSCTAPTPSGAGSPTIAEPDVTPGDRAALAALARQSVEATVRGGPAPPIPDVPGARLRRGAFVTVAVEGALRGCLGRGLGDRPLGPGVLAMAAAAAPEDPRIPPLAPAELLQMDVAGSALD